MELAVGTRVKVNSIGPFGKAMEPEFFTVVACDEWQMTIQLDNGKRYRRTTMDVRTAFNLGRWEVVHGD